MFGASLSGCLVWAKSVYAHIRSFVCFPFPRLFPFSPFLFLRHFSSFPFILLSPYSPNFACQIANSPFSCIVVSDGDTDCLNDFHAGRVHSFYPNYRPFAIIYCKLNKSLCLSSFLPQSPQSVYPNYCLLLNVQLVVNLLLLMSSVTMSVHLSPLSLGPLPLRAFWRKYVKTQYKGPLLCLQSSFLQQPRNVLLAQVQE